MRLAIIASVLCIEAVLVSFLIRGISVTSAEELLAARLVQIHEIQRWLLRFLIAYAGAIVLLAVVARREPTRELDRRGPGTPIRKVWLAAHALFVVLLVGVSGLVDATFSPEARLASAVARPFCVLAAAAALGAAFGPASRWLTVIRRHAGLLGVALIMAAGACLAVTASQGLWPGLSRATVELVAVLLRPWNLHLQIDLPTRTLSTDRFAVIIADACSGLEGMGLILIFCAAWLWYFRREYVMYRALLIIPLAVAIIYLLNAVRLAALLLIGHAGYPAIASAGFHTQAGWVGFNLSAIAAAIIAGRSRWLQRRVYVDAPQATPQPAPQPAPQAPVLRAPRDKTRPHEPVTAFVLPLLVVLGVGMLTRAFSADFDPLYALRCVGGVAVLWIYRDAYRTLDWRLSRSAVLVGVLSGVVWILAARLLIAPVGEPAGVAQLPALQRSLWLLTRLLGAFCVIPIVEELAYRGYLMRRLTHADFDRVDFRAVRWHAIAISAVAFGVVHGALWLPGVLAGAAYAGLVVKTGRIGAAMAAHAVTNACIAGYVLAFNQWQLW